MNKGTCTKCGGELLHYVEDKKFKCTCPERQKDGSWNTSTSKCCEKCEVTSLLSGDLDGGEITPLKEPFCSNPYCECHMNGLRPTTHNQEDSRQELLADAPTLVVPTDDNQEEGKYWPLGSKIPIEVTKTTTKFKLADGNTLILHSDGGFQLEIPERNQEERIVMTGADFTQKQRDAINLLIAQTIQEERERLVEGACGLGFRIIDGEQLVEMNEVLHLIRTNTK